MELQTNLAGISLEHPLMNAAGTCKLLEGKDGVEKLARSATSAIMIGSIPLEFREGNSGNVYWADGRFSLNSLGIPNPGAKYYKKALPEMVRVAHGQGKKLFVSAAGFSPSEYAQLAVVAFEGGADLVELNFGCPNLWKDDQQKRIACFDPDLSGEILYFTEKEVGQEAKISVKISPFSDPFALGEIANVIKQSRMVKAVTAINTFPNAFGYDGKGNPCITPAGGLAGLAGPALKPIGLGQIKQLRDMLPEHIDLIGVGGITTGQDVLDYLRAGARAVQIATVLLQKGAEVFGDILSEMVNAV